MSKLRNKGITLLLALTITVGSLGLSMNSEAATSDWLNNAKYLGYTNNYLQSVNYYSILASAYNSITYSYYAMWSASDALTNAFYAYLYSYYGYLSEPSNSLAKQAFDYTYKTYLLSYYSYYYAHDACAASNLYFLIDAVSNAADASRNVFLAATAAYYCYYK